MRLVPCFPFFTDGPDGGAGGGAPGGVPGGAAPAPGPGPAAVAPPGGGSPAPGGAPGGTGGTPPPPSFSYGEDRSAWVPPDRFTALERNFSALQQRSERLQRMIAAAEGFTRETELDPRIARARAGLREIMEPGHFQVLEALSKRLAQDPRALDSLFDSVPALRSGFEAGETRRGLETIDYMLDAAAKALNVTGGASKLTKFQTSMLANGFTNWVEADPKRIDRYAQGDGRRLATEYITDFQSGFAGPAARVASAPGGGQAAINGRLPAPPARGGVPVGGRPAAKLTEDQVHDNAFKNFTARLAGSRA
jgi:hypothetical protein